ncbi:fumarate hydratase [Heliophilum fasciatum]|uniref:Fumarase class I alpha subunit n=1 Tax=Heliophilum fasciatum TaxID=35700 RepID=A0A4V2SXR9_9FIRM|nr:fumarate hydratase [Heliophilum fasciatum]MCW2277440.1 fumarate hydratase subunit alpha [Heliophilum fasciatum]TCP67276.1 fumarase class I alpha subunit [Heliophilum fasciatum]
MRTIQFEQIVSAVEGLCIQANTIIGDDVLKALQKARDTEESPIGQTILGHILENDAIAATEAVPVCQDTGMAVVFVTIGQEVYIEGGALGEAIHEGVRRGYEKGYLRKSIVKDPLERVNTGDNTPAVIHYDIVPGDKLHILVAPKGFGSENMSSLKMFKPADGVEAVKKFVVQTVENAGPNPCPPIIVGVGLGGTMEKAAILAKRAVVRHLGHHNEKPHLAALEKELLEKVNQLGIGPQGLGGRTTALAVNIESYPTHIAGLPCAVNINCHVARHAEIEL